MRRGLPNGWTNTTRTFRRYVPTDPISSVEDHPATNSTSPERSPQGNLRQWPKRRLRAPYERNARRKSTLRKAGQWASQK